MGAPSGAESWCCGLVLWIGVVDWCWGRKVKSLQADSTFENQNDFL
jgi:hypothetical protein